jgi:hypothetical protein
MVSAPGSRPVFDSCLRRDDLVLDLQADRPRVGVRLARPRLERRLPLGLESFDQGLHPKAGDAVVASDRTLGASLHGDGGDHEPGEGHAASKINRGANYVPRQLPTMSCNQSP